MNSKLNKDEKQKKNVECSTVKSKEIARRLAAAVGFVSRTK